MGVITKRAIEGMTIPQQQILKEMLHVFAVAPAEPLRKAQGASVINVYSEGDYVTGYGSYGQVSLYKDNPKYDIRVLAGESGLWHCSGFIADHAFLAPTYRNASTRHIEILRDKYSFYGGSSEDIR